METFSQVIAWLVVGTGFFGWLVFIPQIRLLLKVKESRSISLGLSWGTFGMQAIILMHAILQKDWHLTFAVGTSLTCLAIMLSLIHYYRKWPGGKF